MCPTKERERPKHVLPTRVLNISSSILSDAEIDLLCKGMSFCPTPDSNMDEFNNDLYDFTRKLRLRYHFRNSNDADPSIVKLPSTYTPPPNEDVELERVGRESRTLV